MLEREAPAGPIGPVGLGLPFRPQSINTGDIHFISIVPPINPETKRTASVGARERAGGISPLRMKCVKAASKHG